MKPLSPMQVTHRILEGRFAGLHCAVIAADRDGIHVLVNSLFATFHPSALSPL